MAIDLMLYFCTPESEDVIWQELLALGPEPIEGWTGRGADWGMVRIRQFEVDDYFRELITGALAVTPQHVLSFRPYYQDENVDPDENITEAVVAFLGKRAGDMAFTFENEVAWLVRRDGRLQIDGESMFARPDLLTRFDRAGLAYELTPLRHLLREWEEAHPD